MCGIAGFVEFNKEKDERILHKMTKSLRHRGPDGEGYLFKEAGGAFIGLGHRRLSIIDLSNCGAQPMSYDGLHLIFNGEIYNYQEIRNKLLAKGHHFQSHSDTEVILHAIREWGLACIDDWNGMFSIALLDEKTNQVMLIRDRAGVKPLYYYWHNDVLLFSSELKGMLAHPSFSKEIDRDALGAFLQYGYVPEPYCIFKHTNKLSPGHYLQFDLSAKKITVTKYWDVYAYYNKPKLKLPLEEVMDETERVLQKGFQYRMVADVPVGVFLSGGFDSTCVTALLQKDSTEKIKTFTIGTDDNKHNEAPYAKQIADYLQTDHTEYYCTPQEALNIIPELPFYFDEPFADSSAIPTILVSRLARKKVTVALSADAGDEIFAGYNKYHYLTQYSKKLDKIPKPMRQLLAVVMNNVSPEAIPFYGKQYNFNSRYQKLKGLLKDPSPQQMMKSITQVFLQDELKKVLADEVVELPTKLTSQAMEKQFYDPLSFMMAVDYQTYMTDDILQKVDRATMSASLEGREPFLDQNIIEWAAQIPSSMKMYGGEKKYLLKQIVYKYVPKQMMDRPKMGFSIPIDNWLKHELKELVFEYLNEGKMQHGLLNTSYIQSLLQSFYTGKSELYLKMWHLLSFQMWYDTWFTTPTNFK